MPITKVAKSTRFIQPGLSLVYYIPTAADYHAVSRTELDAGKDISTDLNAISGFTTTSNNVETPDMESRFVSKIAGLISADDSSLTFWGSSDGADIRVVLPRDTVGYIVFLDGGDIPTTGKMISQTISAIGTAMTRSSTPPRAKGACSGVMPSTVGLTGGRARHA
jgi:hypothetical protein